MKLDEEKKQLDTCIERVLELESDIELVESTLSGKGRSALLRVFIHKPGGVTIDDCARISRRISRELEYDEELQEAYTIEVSSPGLDRKLHTRRDFERVQGVEKNRNVQVGRFQFFTGRFLGHCEFQQVGTEGPLCDSQGRRERSGQKVDNVG